MAQKPRITIQSAKAKARKLQQHVRDIVLAIYTGLEPDDVRSCPMGSSGADLILSPAARARFNYSVECKAYAKFAVYGFIDQARGKPGEPLVVVKANSRKPLAVVDLDHFSSLLLALEEARVRESSREEKDSDAEGRLSDK